MIRGPLEVEYCIHGAYLGLLIKNLLDFSRSRDQRLPGSFLPSPRGKTLGTRLVKSKGNKFIAEGYI
jgi:hypothetical protein